MIRGNPAVSAAAAIIAAGSRTRPTRHRTKLLGLNHGESRQGCERSEVGQGGRSGGTGASGTTPSTRLDGCPLECATQFKVSLGSFSVLNVHSGRLPPGVSTLIRRRDPARKTWATGSSSTRASTNCPLGSGSASASKCVCLGRSSVDLFSSSFRWLARSHPFWT